MKSNKFYWIILRAFDIFAKTQNENESTKENTSTSLLLSIYILFSSGHFLLLRLYFCLFFFFFSSVDFASRFASHTQNTAFRFGGFEFFRLNRIIAIHFTGSLTLSHINVCLRVYLFDWSQVAFAIDVQVAFFAPSFSSQSLSFLFFFPTLLSCSSCVVDSAKVLFGYRVSFLSIFLSRLY